MNLREHSEYYFEIGKELSNLVDDQELVDQLGLAFNRRVQDLINTALNAGSKTDLSSVMQKLTLPEKVDLNPNLNPNPNPNQVGAVDANGSVTGVLPGHWAGAPVDET